MWPPRAARGESGDGDDEHDDDDDVSPFVDSFTTTTSHPRPRDRSLSSSSPRGLLDDTFTPQRSLLDDHQKAERNSIALAKVT